MDKAELYFHSVFQILADLLQDCKAGVKSLKLEEENKNLPKNDNLPFFGFTQFSGCWELEKRKISQSEIGDGR